MEDMEGGGLQLTAAVSKVWGCLQAQDSPGGRSVYIESGYNVCGRYTLDRILKVMDALGVEIHTIRVKYWPKPETDR